MAVDRERGSLRPGTVAFAFALAALPLPGAFGQEASGGPPERLREPADGESSWFSRPNVGYGPYDQAALGFFHSLRLGFSPIVPTYLPDGDFEIRVSESWAKVISEKDDAFSLDYEVLRTQASLGYALSEETVLGLDYNTARRVHGILDPFMNGFHKTFGIPLGPRGRLPDNSFRIELEPGPSRPPIDLDRDAGHTFAQSLVLSVRHALTPGDEVAPSVFLGLSLLPVLDHFAPLRGGPPLEISGSLALSKALGDFILTASGSTSDYGHERYGSLALRPILWSALGALEWHCLDDVSLVAQGLITSGAVESFGLFSKPSYELCYGFKWEVARDFRVDFAMLHDVQNPVAAPDFGFHLELCLRF